MTALLMLFVAVCPLFAVLRLLACRTAAVGSCDILLLLRLGLHLVLVRVTLRSGLEHHAAASDDIIYI